MPIIKWTDNTPEGKKRQKLIESLLPKKPLTEEYLEPELNASMQNVLVKTLKKEIEIYKKYPKKGEYNLLTFDPRNPGKCFMGQGFQGNGKGMEGWYDYELNQYRKAIGTISHTEWGNCTLLEIWGADHMTDHSDMVKGVMAYCQGERKTCPAVEFFVNPFYKNAATGKMIKSEEDEEENKHAAHLNKLANYIEIRDRLKKTGSDKPLSLSIDEKDDEPDNRGKRHRHSEDDGEE